MPDNIDFIEAWNNTIPYKIKPNDLVKPTATFLLNALVNYLFKLNIDVSRVNIGTSELQRTEKIKLCYYINHLYKLSDDSNNFYYIELLNPPPKKTAHLLKILLNYYHYYNMVKTEVIEEASSAISKYDSLLVKRNQQEMDNEKNKIELKNVEVTLKEYVNRLPQLQETHRQCEMKKEQIDSDFVDLETKLKNSEYTIDQTKTQTEKAKNEMVMDSEMKYLLEQIATLDKQIEEYTAMEVTGRDNNQTIVQLIPELQAFNKELENIIEILNAMSTQSSDSKQMHDQLVNQIKEQTKIATESIKQKLETEKTLRNTEMDYQTTVESKGIELKKLFEEIRYKMGHLQCISNDENKCKMESDELELNVMDLQSQFARMSKMTENAFKILLYGTKQPI